MWLTEEVMHHLMRQNYRFLIVRALWTKVVQIFLQRQYPVLRKLVTSNEPYLLHTGSVQWPLPSLNVLGPIEWGWSRH